MHILLARALRDNVFPVAGLGVEPKTIWHGYPKRRKLMEKSTSSSHEKTHCFQCIFNELLYCGFGNGEHNYFLNSVCDKG